MTHRFYAAFVWTIWFASMGWLFVAKIWPTLQKGEPPDYAVTAPAMGELPTVWRISWNDRRIGMAATERSSRADGFAVRHVVQFEKLPLDMMLSETFGPLASFFQPARRPDGPDLELEMLFATDLRFDVRGQFTQFQTIGDLGAMESVLQIQGRINERRKLQLTTRLGGTGPGSQRFRHEIDFPPNAIVNDAFTPRQELRNLQVGQQWTIPVYRPFPPNSPPQIIAARAERHELILWDGRDVETILVVYRTDAGSGLQTNDEPDGREWVRSDGLVLQHEVRWGNTTVRFERIADPTLEPILKLFDKETHPRLWTPGTSL